MGRGSGECARFGWELQHRSARRRHDWDEEVASICVLFIMRPDEGGDFIFIFYTVLLFLHYYRYHIYL